VRELLKSYQFPGDDLPVCDYRVGGIEREAKWEKQVDRADGGGDKYIPQTARDAGQAVSDAD